MAILEHHIRECLSRYLAGEISLAEFELWFVPRVWDVERTSADGELRHMVHSIELSLAEYTNGHWTEGELREQLKPYAHAPLMEQIEIHSTVTLTSTTSRTTAAVVLDFQALPGVQEPHQVTTERQRAA